MATTNGTTNGAQRASDQLLERLNEPRTAEALNRLLDHAELLAFSAASLDGFIRRGELIADNVAASVADLKRSLPADQLPDSAQIGRMVSQIPRLVDNADRLNVLLEQPEFTALLELLSKPETLNAVASLLRHAELLTFLVGALEALLSRGEELTDNIRSSVRDVSSTLPASEVNLFVLIETLVGFLPYLPRLVAVAPKFIEIIERLEPFVASPEFDALLNSGVFQPETVSLVGRAGDAFVSSYEDTRRTGRKVGLLGLLSVLRDPDTQRALGLLTDFGKRFGHSLDR